MKKLQLRHDLIVLAREAKGWSQSALGEAAGISQPTISRLELGGTDADYSVLEKVAKALVFPPEFFVLTDRAHVGGNCFKYRKLKTIGVKLLRAVEAQSAILALRVARLLRGDFYLEAEREFKHLDLGKRGDVLTPKDAGTWVRANWGLPTGPIRSVTQAVEDAGGIIMVCDFGTPKITAISQWVPPRPPMFFMNKDLTGDRYRLSLAHEMGHVFLHHNPSTDAETEAFAFGSEFLMPEREIRSSLHGATLARLADLKPHWGVSMGALARWAKEIKAISEQDYTFMNIDIASNGWKRREPIDIPLEQPTLLARVIDAHREAGWTDQDLKTALLIEDEAEYRRFLASVSATAGQGGLRLI